VVLSTNLSVTYIFDQDDSAAVRAVFDDDVLELFWIGEAAHDADRHLKGLRRIGGLLAKLTGGNLDVLLRERVGDVERGEAAGCEAAGIEPETHRVFAFSEDDDVADAGNTFECVLDIDVDVVGDVGRRERLVRRD